MQFEKRIRVLCIGERSLQANRDNGMSPGQGSLEVSYPRIFVFEVNLGESSENRKCEYHEFNKKRNKKYHDVENKS